MTVDEARPEREVPGNGGEEPVAAGEEPVAGEIAQELPDDTGALAVEPSPYVEPVQEAPAGPAEPASVGPEPADVVGPEPPPAGEPAAQLLEPPAGELPEERAGGPSAPGPDQAVGALDQFVGVPNEASGPDPAEAIAAPAVEAAPGPVAEAAAAERPTVMPAGRAVAAALAAAGVRLAFTVPGESFLGVLDGMAEAGVRVVATRHESGAAFMAEAVGQLTGRPAACLATRAVGAANLAIGLHTARADSSPLIAIVGQVRRSVQGREAFQEADLVASLGRFCKWSGEASDASAIPALVAQAVEAATSGRPGPVLLSLPEDLLDEPVDASPVRHARPRAPEPDGEAVRRSLHLLADARRPVVLAGAGVLRARCTDALVKLVETLELPVVTSWRRPDAFPNDHRLYLGSTGLGAAPTVLERLEQADALLVLGSRLNEIASFDYRVPGAATRWVHVDLEPRTPRNGLRGPDLAIGADAAAFVRAAMRRLGGAVADAGAWEERRVANAADRAAYEAASVVDAEPWDGPGIHPGRVVATLVRTLPPEATLATDAGNFAGWLARGYPFRRPGTFLGPTSGAMGYGLPAAIAAAIARPGRPVLAVAGDGGFAMTMSELETAVRERLRLVALVFDNRRYGTIWLHQEHRGSGRGIGTELGPIDFAAAAEAFGARGFRVDSDEAFEPALRAALASEGPSVIHLQLDPRWQSVDERAEA